MHLSLYEIAGIMEAESTAEGAPELDGIRDAGREAGKSGVGKGPSAGGLGTVVFDFDPSQFPNR
jgi:hypothetical protein